MSPRASSPAFRYWLLVGLVLHVGAGLVLQRSRAAGPRPVSVPPPLAHDLELYLEEAPPAGVDADEPAQVETIEPALAAAPRDPAGSRRASVARNNPRLDERVASAAAPAHREPSASTGGEAASSGAAPRHPLTLDELGVGARNPFVGDEPARAGAKPAGREAEGTAARSARKLEQSIETALARRDQRIGLGPEGQS
jgi:hypothetical protein